MHLVHTSKERAVQVMRGLRSVPSKTPINKYENENENKNDPHKKDLPQKKLSTGEWMI